jgi:hypothetical protein
MTEENQVVIKENNPAELNSDTMSKLVLRGDMSGLSEEQKVEYYICLCKSMGLNPATKPFQIIKFQGREIMYATKDCTEQLRKIHGVSICELDKQFQDGMYIVTAKAQDKDGRYDAATGVTFITGLKGDALANSIMKAESKAKRRVTLSICGLGMLDESETDTIGKYQKIDVKSGEIIEGAETKQDTRKPEDFFKQIEISDFEQELKAIYLDAAQWSVCLNGEEAKKFLEDIIAACKKKKAEFTSQMHMGEDKPINSYEEIRG